MASPQDMAHLPTVPTCAYSASTSEPPQARYFPGFCTPRGSAGQSDSEAPSTSDLLSKLPAHLSPRHSSSSSSSDDDDDDSDSEHEIFIKPSTSTSTAPPPKRRAFFASLHDQIRDSEDAVSEEDSAAYDDDEDDDDLPVTPAAGTATSQPVFVRPSSYSNLHHHHHSHHSHSHHALQAYSHSHKLGLLTPPSHARRVHKSTELGMPAAAVVSSASQQRRLQMLQIQLLQQQQLQLQQRCMLKKPVVGSRPPVGQQQAQAQTQTQEQTAQEQQQQQKVLAEAAKRAQLGVMLRDMQLEL